MKVRDVLRALRAVDDDDPGDDDPNYDPEPGEEEPDPDQADPSDDDDYDDERACPDCEQGTCPYETGEAYQ